MHFGVNSIDETWKQLRKAKTQFKFTLQQMQMSFLKRRFTMF